MTINKSTIKDSIIQGNIELAIKMLLKLAEKHNEDLYTSAILLSSRMNSLKKSQMTAVISSDNYNLSRNKIMLALKSTLEDVEDSWQVEDSTIKPQPNIGNERAMETTIAGVNEENDNKKARTILFLAANPQDSRPLRLDEEVREIEEGLRRSKHRDSFKFVQKWAVRVSDLTRSLLDEKPSIVHFSGHGSPKGRIVLEDEIGSGKEIPAKSIGKLFSVFKEYVDCVILNACYSESQAKEISKFIPYVVGMNQAIDDRAAIKFSSSFYDAIASGEDIEFAFDLAKISIELNGIEGEDIPVLIKKESA